MLQRVSPPVALSVSRFGQTRRCAGVAILRAKVQETTTIGDPSQSATGLFREVLRINSELFIVHPGQACLLERFHLGKQVYLFRAVRIKLTRIQVVAELGFGEKRNGIVQHVENVFASHPADGRSEPVSIYVLVGHEALPFPARSIYYLIF